jgi:hypothetical protein
MPPQPASLRKLFFLQAGVYIGWFVLQAGALSCKRQQYVRVLVLLLQFVGVFA